MKTQIRRGVFETNSSSVHTLSITTTTDWDRFKKGELLMKGYPYDISFVDANSVDKEQVFTYDKYDDGEYYSDYEYMTYDTLNYLDDAEIIFKKLDNVLAISVYKYED